VSRIGVVALLDCDDTVTLRWLSHTGVVALVDRDDAVTLH